MAYIYIILFLVITSILFWFLQNLSSNKKSFKNSFLLLAFFVLASFMGLRMNNVGYDTEGYYMIFNYISRLPLYSVLADDYIANVEWFYALLNKLSSLLMDDYYLFQMFVSFAFCLGMMNFIKLNTKSYIFSTFLFLGTGLYILAFNIARQCLAIAICCYGYQFLKEDKKIPLALCILLAYAIHHTAVIFLVVVLLYKFRHIKILPVLFPLALFVGFLSFRFLLIIFLQYFPEYAGFLNDNERISLGFIVAVWALESFLALNLFFGKNRDNMFIAMMVVLYIFFTVMGTYISYMERVALYFSPFVIVMFDIMARKFRQISVRYAFFIFTVIGFLVMFYITTTPKEMTYSTFL